MSRKEKWKNTEQDKEQASVLGIVIVKRVQISGSTAEARGAKAFVFPNGNTQQRRSGCKIVIMAVPSPRNTQLREGN